MIIHILAVGSIKEGYLRDGAAEYLRRLTPYVTVRVTEIAEARLRDHPAESEISRALAQEATGLIAGIRPGGIVLALDRGGEAWTSDDLAGLLSGARMDGRDMTFLIGGPWGLSPQALAAAERRISLSRLTFTHQMARLILLEQIYRGFRIIHREPYHR